MAIGEGIEQHDESFLRYRDQRATLWNEIASKFEARKSSGAFYHNRLRKVYSFLIPVGKRVLEIGCGYGDLLACLKPSYGVGVDFSSTMIEVASKRHPELTWVCSDAHDFKPDETFDVIILSDVINDLWDVQCVLDNVSKLSHPGTRVYLNYHSRLWEAPLGVARNMGMARPILQQNWLTPADVHNLLYLTGFEVIRKWEEVLFPVNIPFIEKFFNNFLVKIVPFNLFALTNFTLARPNPVPVGKPETVSVIVPARNEAGNILSILERVPEMGGGTELIFVEGNSKDDTYQVIEKTIQQFPDKRVTLYQQTGKGKGDAVRLGFSKANGDILMILDADLTVPPEDLPRFYDILVSGKGEMVNGVRLVYPMEKEAMRFFNLLGNKFFSLVFSWLLGQQVKDTLCGTKVLRKSDYEAIARNRSYFGDFDPFGDFDLLFGAAKLNLKIVDVPVRYRERTYGETNIQRWKHGWLLIQMVGFAAKRLKFI